MKTQHTLGPWLRSKSGNTFQIVAGSDGNGDPNELVATVHPIGYNCDYEPCDETKANARLISAAPELLSALEDALEELKHASHIVNLRKDVIDQCKAVLTKTKGE